jgi:hypothetical protein
MDAIFEKIKNKRQFRTKDNWTQKWQPWPKKIAWNKKGNLDEKKTFNNYKLSHFTNVAPTSMLLFKCPSPLLFDTPTINTPS